MADTKLLYASAATLSVTNITGLGNVSSANSAAIDNSTTGYFDIEIMLQVTTGSATANTTVEIWVKGSLDGTNFEDDNNDTLVGVISVVTSGVQTLRRIVSAASGFSGPLPPYVMLRVRNATGTNLGTATASYVGLLTQST